MGMAVAFDGLKALRYRMPVGMKMTFDEGRENDSDNSRCGAAATLDRHGNPMSYS